MTAAAPCPLCHAAGNLVWDDCRDLEYFIEADFPFYRCGACNFVYMHPLPSREVLPTLYPSDYQNYEPPANPLSAFLVRRFHAHHAALSRRYLPPGGRLLEVGAAGGDVLALLREGGHTDVQGVEISADGVAAARAKGLRVFHGTVEEFVPDGPFDVILMSHVIEHVLDPVGSVQKIFELLTPGGFFLVETPNVGALDARLWGRQWGLVHYPRHLYLFDRGTLRRLLSNAGFEVCKMSWEINSCGWALSFQGALRRLGVDRSRRPRSVYYPLLLAATLPLNALDLCLGGTAFMSAIARKPGGRS